VRDNHVTREHTNLAIALFADFRGTTSTATQVVQLGTTHVTVCENFKFCHCGAVLWKRALDTYAVAEFANCVGLGNARTLDGNDVAMKNLDALFAAFNNAYVHLDLVTRLQFGDVGAQVLVVNKIGALHGAFPLLLRSGLVPAEGDR